jgi:hypothetical protein
MISLNLIQDTNIEITKRDAEKFFLIIHFEKLRNNLRKVIEPHI